MAQKKSGTIMEHFAELPDPRIDRQKRHILLDIVVIAICGVICGADDWVAIERFGKAKIKWFKQFLELPNGIPSHDTFGRVFARISPMDFQKCFTNWIQSVADIFDGEIVAIDGKTLRRSHDRASDKAAIHMVSAWASKNRLVLGQVKTEEKSNEITAIPKLLETLDVQGCIVTIDAMGCQKKITQKIVDQGADYVLALKGNQEKLSDEVESLFDKVHSAFRQYIPIDFYETEDKEHGRVEHRRYWTTDQIEELENAPEWSELRTVGMVESERCVNGEVSIEHRYYICSIPNDAKLFAYAVRNHWGIENGLHWVLDMAFREDESRVRTGNAPENLATLRHIAINLLKNEKSIKVGIKNKRLICGWDNDYLVKVLKG
jgi:predicted transposase YbfD/YdcC